MFRPVSILISFVLLSAHAKSQSCTDIRTFDFKNAAVPIAARDDGGHSGPDTFHLQDGKGFISDNPDLTQSRDWQLNLFGDRLIHPDASTWLRVITIDRLHLTGTGDWNYILAFTCTKGSLEPIFQYGSEGAEIKHLDAHTLELSQAVRAENDAHCCPSKVKQIIYHWNAKLHRYVR
jgi:hypothetical protein